MEGLWQDSFAVTIALLTLAVGIGANSGIFSVMRQVPLPRLPMPHPEELVLLYAPGPRTGHISSDEGEMGQSPFPIPGTQTCGTGAPF